MELRNRKVTAIPAEATHDRLLVRIDQLLTELSTHWNWIAEEEYYLLLRRLRAMEKKAETCEQ